MTNEGIDERILAALLQSGALQPAQVSTLRARAAAGSGSVLQELRSSGLIHPAALEALRARLSVLDSADDTATIATSRRTAPASPISAPPHPADPVAVGTTVAGEIPLPGASAPGDIGPYEVLGELGRGGMGVVYRARHRTLGRECALKVLLPGPDADPEVLTRFIAEARAIEDLSDHPGIIDVLDVGQAGTTLFMAMELVEGTTLKTLIEHDKVSPRAGARVVAAIADALAHAHSRGIIHRDIKPANILIERATSRARLSDFGVAKLGQESSQVTLTGAMLGTISYMAPEQAEDSKLVDRRTDVYGLGAVLYECLTGRPPHIGDTPTNTLASLLTKAPPSPRSLNPDVPRDLEAICLKALGRDPDKRFQDAGEFREALEAYRHGGGDLDDSERADGFRPPKSVIAAAVVIGLLFLIGAILKRGEAPDAKGPGPIAKVPVDPTPKPGPIEPPKPATPTGLLSCTPDDGAIIGESAAGWIDGKGLEIKGEVVPRDARVQLKLDGQDQPYETRATDGRFRFEPLLLQDGERRFELVILRADGTPLLSPPARRVTIDRTPPELLIRNTIPKSTLQRNLLVRLVVEDRSPVKLAITPKPTSRRDRSVGDTVEMVLRIPIAPGGTEVRIQATDAAGNSSTRVFDVDRRGTTRLTVIGAPKDPKEPIRVGDARFVIRGRVVPVDARVAIGGQSVTVRELGAYSHIVTLSEGEQTILVEATSALGRVRRPLRCILDTKPPQLTFEGLVQPEGATDEFLRELPKGDGDVVIRSSEELELCSVVIAAGGQENRVYHERLAANGVVTLARADIVKATVKQPTLSISVTATDLAGHRTVTNRTIQLLGKTPELQIDDPLIALARSAAPGAKHPFVITGKVTPSGTVLKDGNETIEVAADGRFRLDRKPWKRLKRSTGLRLAAVGSTGETIKRKLESDPDAIESLESWQALGSTEGGQLSRAFLVARIAERLAPALQFVGAETYRCGAAETWIPVFAEPTSGMLFHLVPGGRVAGGHKDLRDIYNAVANSPPRKIRSDPLLILRTKVLGAHWGKLEGLPEILTGVERLKITLGAQKAISGLSVSRVATWLERANKALGLRGRGRLRLPTEREWEWACRAGRSGRFYWEGGDFQTRNAFGLEGMALVGPGEWCADAYAPKSEQGRALRKAGIKLQALRGIPHLPVVNVLAKQPGANVEQLKTFFGSQYGSSSFRGYACAEFELGSFRNLSPKVSGIMVILNAHTGFRVVASLPDRWDR